SKMVAVNKESVTYLMQPRPNLADCKMNLSLKAFLGRYLEHIPPPGFHIVRGYGLYSASWKLKVTNLPERPVTTEARPAMPFLVQEDLPIDEPYRCPACRAVFATPETMRMHRRGGYRRAAGLQSAARASPVQDAA
ncbi:MAG: transposase, partial [Planctomycetota bacterium]